MRACTFVTDGTVGLRKYKRGATVILPEAFVRALIRRGAVVAPPPADLPPPAPEQGPVEERVTKPAPILSKRALSKLLRRRKG